MTANYIDPDTAPVALSYVVTTTVAPIALVLLGIVLGLSMSRSDRDEKFRAAPFLLCVILAALICAGGFLWVPRAAVMV